MSPYRNSNFIEARRLIEQHGGKVTGRRAGSRHFVVYFETAKGNKAKLTLSKAPMRSGTVSFYLTRNIREADRTKK